VLQRSHGMFSFGRSRNRIPINQNKYTQNSWSCNQHQNLPCVVTRFSYKHLTNSILNGQLPVQGYHFHRVFQSAQLAFHVFAGFQDRVPGFHLGWR